MLCEWIVHHRDFIISLSLKKPQNKTKICFRMSNSIPRLLLGLHLRILSIIQ